MTSESKTFAGRALVAFVIGLAGATALECAIRLSSRGTTPMTASMVTWAVSLGVLFGTPLAMLPALWYARTRSSVNALRSGLLTTGAGIVLTMLVVGWIAPLGMRAYSLERIERIRRTVDEAARARRQTSDQPAVPRNPGRRGGPPPVRPMTPEEAIGVDAALKTWPDLILSAQIDQQRARLYQIESRRRAELTGLAVIMAFLGWTLGSLGRVHALHAVMWWAAAWLMTVRTPGVTAGAALLMIGVAAVTLRMLSQTTASGPTPPVVHNP